MKALLKNLAIALTLIGGTYAAGVTGLCLAAGNTNCDRATASTQIVESLYGKNNPAAIAGDKEGSAIMQDFIYKEDCYEKNTHIHFIAQCFALHCLQH